MEIYYFIVLAICTITIRLFI